MLITDNQQGAIEESARPKIASNKSKQQRRSIDVENAKEQEEDKEKPTRRH